MPRRHQRGLRYPQRVRTLVGELPADLAWRTHSRSVSGLHPILPLMDAITAHSGLCSPLGPSRPRD